MNPLVVISGISGSGKTTIGKALAEKLNFTFIDLDDFFLSEKPIVTLSNNSQVKNWDCFEALDLEEFKHSIKYHNKRGGVVAVGFAICNDILPFSPTYHLHPILSDTPEMIIERCIASRLEAKKVNPEKNILIVRELVFPFYLKVSAKSNVDLVFCVFDHLGQRQPVSLIVDSLLTVCKF